VVAERRWSEAGPPLAPARMPLGTAEFWPGLAHGPAHLSGSTHQMHRTPRVAGKRARDCPADRLPGTQPLAGPRSYPPFSSTGHETTEMMTLSRGTRGGVGGLLRAATHVVAAALVVTAMFAAMWAGPLASASARAQSRAASPSPARVKFYIVPPPRNGHAESLFAIAAKTLGDGSQFMEIFNLNKGRLQPNGGRLTNPQTIEPGWILQLPADAAGPWVHFGPLPVVHPPTSSVSRRPSRPVADREALPNSRYGGLGTGIETIGGGALIVLATGLALVLIRRRRGGATVRRRVAHAKTLAPRPPDRTGPSATTGLNMPYPDPGRQHPRDRDPGWSPPYDDHPSWPYPPDPDPSRPPPRDPDQSWSPPYGDHPSSPQPRVPDQSWSPPYGEHPSSPQPRVPDQSWSPPYDDHPSWPYPRVPGPGWQSPAGGSGGPGRESRPVLHHSHDQYGHDRYMASPSAGAPRVRAQADDSGPPATPTAATPDTLQRWAAQLPRTEGPAPQAYYDVGRLHVVLTEPPANDWEGATALGTHAQVVLQFPGEQWTAPAGPARTEESLRLASRILSDADRQAAEIRQQASAEADAIREAAERDATALRQQARDQDTVIREAAERDAVALTQQAATRAAAIREAAERDAAELRATLTKMSAELSRVAAYVAENLDSTAMPATAPVAWPETQPAARPAEPVTRPAEPTAKPAAQPRQLRAMPRPAVRPDQRPARPATRPARRTEKPARSRQSHTMRVFAGTITALVVLALGTGAYQLATRGFTFFVFRSAGTGATDNNAIFPGIIPTPKPSPAHHHPTTGPGQHGARRTHHHVKRTAGR
jgi:hypothetical protein